MTSSKVKKLSNLAKNVDYSRKINEIIRSGSLIFNSSCLGLEVAETGVYNGLKKKVFLNI